MLLSLGCEKLQPERLLPPGSCLPIQPHSGEAIGHVRLQDEEHVGLTAMVNSVLVMAEHHLQRLNQRRRQTLLASALVVGMQCGGRDAFGSVTASSTLCFCTDLLVRAGATVLFSETTELRDAVEQLSARAATPEVAQRRA